METIKFKTKSEIIERRMPKITGNNQYRGKTIIAIDGGYSSVKGASPERVFMFPSFAKKAPNGLEIIAKVSDVHLMFRDNKTGEVWLVGQSAEELMDQIDLESTTDTSLYTRYRYDSDMFKVLMATGMALGLWGTPEGNEVFLQTGLPSAYKVADAPKLISALVGDYDISIKVGPKNWVDFKFSLDKDHISVMEQPQGTLSAIAYENGEETDFGQQVLRSNSIIFDVGFGTEDIFPVRKGMKITSKTFSDTAMKSVFDGVIKEMQKLTPAEFKIFELQNFLESGVAPYFDQFEFKQEFIDFSDILEKQNRELCEKSIIRLMQEFQNLQDYKYLIVTGGTGESRFEQIKEKLSVIPTLTVLPGNLHTPDLSYCYSNVIGYYMFRHALTMKTLAKAGK